MTEDTQLNLKQEIIKAEILDKRTMTKINSLISSSQKKEHGG